VLQLGVRERLEPDGFGERLAGIVIGARGRLVVERQHAPGPSRDRVEAHVGRDPVQPRAKPPRAAEPRQRAPRPRQRLLERVVGVVQRPEHPVAVDVKRRAVRLDEPAKRVLVAAADRIEQVLIRRSRACGRGGHCPPQIRPAPAMSLAARAGSRG